MGFDLINDNAIIIVILKTMVEADIIGEAGPQGKLSFEPFEPFKSFEQFKSFLLSKTPNSLNSLNNLPKFFPFELNLDELSELSKAHKSFDATSLIKDSNNINTNASITKNTISAEPKTDIDILENTITDLDSKKYYLLEDYIDKDVAWGVWPIRDKYQNLDIPILINALRDLGIFLFTFIYCNPYLSKISHFPLKLEDYSFFHNE